MMVGQEVAMSVLATTNTISRPGPFNGATWRWVRAFLYSFCAKKKKTFCEKSIRSVDLVFYLNEDTNIS